MVNIHIVLDSTANVPSDLLIAYPNLHVVPLTVILGHSGQSELDLTCDEMFKLAREQGVHPRTSQPAPGDFAAVFASIADGNQVIMIGVAGGVSGTVNGARSVAKNLKDREIYIIDSGTAAVGMVRLAEAALKMAADGMAAAAIAARLELMAKATHTLFIPDSLEYLHKGGRIGGAAALFGTILQIKPILGVIDGKIQVVDKVRTKAKAVTRMLAELAQYGNHAYIGVVHGGAAVMAQEIFEQVSQRYPDTPVSLTTIGPVLSAHLGPGIVGVIFQSKL